MRLRTPKKPGMLAGGLISVALLGLGAAPGTAATGDWQVAPPVPVEDGSGAMESVKPFAPNDVWVGGAHQYYAGDGLVSPIPVMRHWDGQRWNSVPLDCRSTDCTYQSISSIDGVANNDLWAVGSVNDNMPAPALLQHWDGKQWSNVPMPDADNLYSVHAVAANDVWVAGAPGLIEHWDGKQWTTVQLPPELKATAFRDVTATGPSDVWAVGSQRQGEDDHPLVAHWDGRTWSKVDVPATPDGYSGREATQVTAGNGQVWVATVGVFRDEVVPITFHIDSAGITKARMDQWKTIDVGDMVMVGDRPRMSFRDGLASVPMVEWRDGKWVDLPGPPAPRGYVLDGLGTMPNTGEMWAAGWIHPPEHSKPWWRLAAPFVASYR